MSIETPYSQHRATVQKEWIDYNGHLNVGYYHVVFDIAVEPFFHWLGLDPAFRKKHNGTTFALEAHLNFFREVLLGDELRFETRLLDFDHKRVHFFSEMYHAGDDYLAASHESVSSWVDLATRKTTPLPDEILDRLAAIKAAHASLPRPWQLGHAISAHPPA